MVALLTLANILNYLDRYLVPALLPLLVAEFGLNHEQSGRLQSAFVIGYVVCSPIFGYLGDRTRRPILMAAGIVLWSVATFSSGLTHSLSLLFAVRAAVGVGEASFVTCAPGYLKDLLRDPLKVNRALAWFSAAIPIGSALGYVAGGWLGGAYGWRGAFMICAIPGLLLGALVAFKPEVRQAPPANVSVGQGVRSILRVPALWFAIGGYVLNAFALNGIATYIVRFGEERAWWMYGLPTDAAGSIISAESGNTIFGGILVIAGFIGSLGGGRLIGTLAGSGERFIQRMFVCIGAASLLAMPLLFFAFQTQSMPNFFVLCFFAELLIFAATPGVNTIIVLMSPEDALTLTQGVTLLALNLFGALLANELIGRLADVATLGSALQLCSVAIGLSAFVWLAGVRTKPLISKEV